MSRNQTGEEDAHNLIKGRLTIHVFFLSRVGAAVQPDLWRRRRLVAALRGAAPNRRSDTGTVASDLLHLCSSAPIGEKQDIASPAAPNRVRPVRTRDGVTRAHLFHDVGRQTELCQTGCPEILFLALGDHILATGCTKPFVSFSKGNETFRIVLGVGRVGMRRPCGCEICLPQLFGREIFRKPE